MKKYRSEKAILNLVELFETATISREAWKHAEHLTVALYYITNHDIETATNKMRSGILKLLREGFKVDLAKEMPYHETLTVFWMRTVSEFNASKNGDSSGQQGKAGVLDRVTFQPEKFGLCLIPLSGAIVNLGE